MQIDLVMSAIALLLVLAVLSSKFSAYIRLPGALILLLLGMLAGTEGIGGIPFSDHHIAQQAGTVALCFILFSGGLHTKWSVIHPILWSGVSLSTIAVCVSTVLVGYIAVLVLHFSWIEGLLFGAIVSSTDAATVFSLFQTQKIAIPNRLRTLIEFEAGSNDPTAVILTLGLIQYAQHPEASLWHWFQDFALQMGIGGISGWICGKSFPWILRKIHLYAVGLYPVLTIGMMLAIYPLTQYCAGNGFLATYLSGVFCGNQRFPHRPYLIQFHDGLSWFMQITMFVALGLLVNPSELWAVARWDIGVALFLFLVARPLSVWIALANSRWNAREKLLISWAGLRGAVPIILATFPLVAAIPRANALFDQVFFVVLGSVLIQGSTLTLCARMLQKTRPKK